MGADSDHDISFTLTTRAELAGAQALATQLERQIGQAKALGKDYSDLAKQLDQVNTSMAGAKIPAAEEIESTDKLRLGKRELLESIRGLTREYPMLGEVARSLFNPVTISVFGLIEAYHILEERTKNLTQMFGSVELPDLSEGTTSAQDMATAWEGITTSVNNADSAFGGFEAIHKREVTNSEAQLKATTAQIEAVKNLALAQLNVARANGMGQGEYERKKEIIERGASDATVQAEIDARNRALAAKVKERDNAAAEEARELAASQNHLPQSDPKIERNKADLTAQAEALKKQGDEARALAKKMSDLQDEEGDQGFSPAKWRNDISAFGHDVAYGRMAFS